MKLRREFILKALAHEVPFRELCREFGVSRKTGYKWLERFQKRGFEGLVNGSTRPQKSPEQTTSEMALEIIRFRQAHPTWGPKKIHRLLSRTTLPDADLPSIRTISRVLSRVHLLRRRIRRRPSDQGWMLQASRKQVVVAEANDLWTVDFKGWWTTRDGQHCEPLTVRDAFSRCVLALRILPRSDTNAVRAVFEELFVRHGLPKTIQSDNGAPFAAARSLAGLTQLSAWWISLGIDVVRSRPGCPQDNGAHERMHADIKIEIQTRRAPSIHLQQRACDDWRVEFNHVRPHEALGMRTPAEVYRPSPRQMMHALVGGFPDGVDIVQLHRNGKFWLNRRYHVFVSTAIGGKQVGLQTLANGDIHVWYHHLLVGYLRIAPGTGTNISVSPFTPSDVHVAHDAAKVDRLSNESGALPEPRLGEGDAI